MDLLQRSFQFVSHNTTFASPLQPLAYDSYWVKRDSLNFSVILHFTEII